uniref:Uncharacterized protein n=1 Tax=Populus trichocarpa TaxID=3694 RepID=A0A2K1X2Z4_POPTR
MGQIPNMVCCLILCSGSYINEVSQTCAIFVVAEITQSCPYQKLVDPTLGGQWPESEVLKCIHIRLFCVQEAVADGPTMSQIVMMLSG